VKYLLVTFTIFGFMHTTFAQQDTQVEKIRSIRASEHSCAQIRAWVAQDGVVYIRYWMGGNYYYASGLSCGRGYIPVAGWVKAAGGEYCHAGYICRQTHGDDD
jgi:hypothetical protein